MHYVISPKKLNTIIETEMFSHPDYESLISVSTKWKKGSYLVRTNKDNQLPKKLEEKDSTFWVTNYDWELITTIDPTSVQIDIERASNLSYLEEKTLDQLEITLEAEYNYNEVLVENGWSVHSIDVVIEGPVEAVAVNIDE
jgi:hypothetical protein